MATVEYMTPDGTPLLESFWFRDAEGNMAEISGDPPAVQALQLLLEKIGLAFDDQSCSYYCTSSGVASVES